MSMSDDAELLHQFAQRGSETAFGEIVQRHLDAVYSTALRLTAGQSGLAQDIAQTVFTDLARKAGSLPPATLLGGWLYRATRLAAAAALRSEFRREVREKEATMQQEINRAEHGASWDGIRPLLDDALDELKEPDREALLLRFFQQRSLRDVGGALGVSEDAARMRIDRALDRLRGALASRGVSSTAAALGLILESNAVVAAPALLAHTISAAAVTAAVAPVGTLSIVTIMSTTAVKIAVPLALAAIFAVPLFYQHRAIVRLEAENATLRTSQGGPEGGETPTAAAADLSQLNLEIARLRSEVASKRALEKELTAAKASLARQAKAVSAVQSSPEQSDDAAEQMKQIGYARMGFAKDFAVKLIMYADKHGGRFPGPGDDVASVTVPPLEVHGVQLSMDRFELLFTGVWTDIGNSAQAVIGRERDPWPAADGRIARTYLFADGHSEIHNSASLAEMDRWEQEHLPQLVGK